MGSGEIRDKQAAERAVRELLEAGEVDAATAMTLRTFGDELFRFLVTLLRDHDEASDVFSTVSEQIWKGLPGFAWRSSLRTWLFAVSRNACFHHRQTWYRRNRTPLPPELEELRAEVRTRTLTFLRTETKQKLEELRAELTQEEQALLALRLDRGMSWDDVARAMGEPEEELDDGEIGKRAATLRKRFERTKERLKKLAQQHGVIGR